MEFKIQNALIEKAEIDTCEGIGITVRIVLDYGGSCQVFGGHVLYTHKAWDQDNLLDKNYCGHFISRCLSVAGVDKWSDIAGKTVRVKARHTGIKAIGHIIDDNWFDPGEDFV